jgi:hypothetical protein
MVGRGTDRDGVLGTSATRVRAVWSSRSPSGRSVLGHVGAIVREIRVVTIDARGGQDIGTTLEGGDLSGPGARRGVRVLWERQLPRYPDSARRLL